MVLTEAQLMSECSPLYSSFALESFANFCLGLFFVYLSVVITGKGKLKTPARDTALFVRDAVGNRFNDVMSIVQQWSAMKSLPLEKRFRFCRKVNATICQFSALVSFLAVTRWLHINNVNGFRYLGYSLTCPPMQAEILVLIAPVVPFYRFFVYLSVAVTFLMLITGWIASCIQDDLWTGKFMEWVESGFKDDLEMTTKGWMFVASCGFELYLVLIQLPFVLFLYYWHRGPKAGLPEGFPRMVVLVWVTWMCFPLWWSISYEGFRLIEDTKMNGIGFVLLNVVSKGGFTISILRMVRLHKEKGLIPRTSSSDNMDWLGTFGPNGRAQHAADGTASAGTSHSGSAPMGPVQTTLSGDAWFTSVLAKYEADSHAASSRSTAASASAGAGRLESEGKGKAALHKLEASAHHHHHDHHAHALHGHSESHPQGSFATWSTDALMQEMLRRVVAGEVTLTPTPTRPVEGQQQAHVPETLKEECEEEEIQEDPKLMNV